MMNEKEKVQISLDPEIAGMMSPEGLQRAIQRRIDAAQRRAVTLRRRRMVAGLVLASCTCLAGLGVLASTHPAEDDAVQPIVITEDVTVPDEPQKALWDITDEEQMAVIGAVMAVARGESFTTKMAVAQAIRDVALKDSKSVEEVLEDFHYPTYEGETSEDATKAVEAIVAGEDAVPGVSLHSMYNPDVQSGTWHEGTGDFICQMGKLKFFGVANEK